MKNELSALLGRSVDLNTPRFLSRYIRDRVVQSPRFCMPKQDDATRLRHMLDAARKAVALVEGKGRPALDQDETLGLAVVRLLEILGEAAQEEYRQNFRVALRKLRGKKSSARAII